MFKSEIFRFFWAHTIGGLALFVGLTISASAGTPAQAIDALSLRLGPGNHYQTAFDLDQGANVSVERCQNRWCLVASGSVRGWVSIDHLTFGVEPRGPFSGPKRDQVLRGDGQICFHTGTHFSGASVCATTGTVVHDLALYGHDNSFSSISIEGDLSAHVCREFNFGSYCETITENQPVLSRFLRRAVSSYRVW